MSDLDTAKSHGHRHFHRHPGGAIQIHSHRHVHQFGEWVNHEEPDEIEDAPPEGYHTQHADGDPQGELRRAAECPWLPENHPRYAVNPGDGDKAAQGAPSRFTPARAQAVQAEVDRLLRLADYYAGIDLKLSLEYRQMAAEAAQRK